MPTADTLLLTELTTAGLVQKQGMFTLAVLKENIKLSPSKLRNDFIQAIVLALNQKYCNRVIIDVGLCISVFDILEAGDPYVHSGEASAFVKGK